MPRRITTITIGSALRRSNERFKSMSWEDMKAYLDAMESSDSVETAAKGGQGPLETKGQVKHHNEFVGNGPGSFFPEIDAALKNDVMRAAIIQAMRVALYSELDKDGTGLVPRQQPLPIVSYWISGVQTFEAYVDRSDNEVHMFLVTPDPAPIQRRLSADDVSEEEMWVCAAPGRVQAIRERAAECDFRDPVNMPRGLTAECQQVLSF
jgi:hypothetical protein